MLSWFSCYGIVSTRANIRVLQLLYWWTWDPSILSANYLVTNKTSFNRFLLFEIVAMKMKINLLIYIYLSWIVKVLQKEGRILCTAGWSQIGPCQIARTWNFWGVQSGCTQVYLDLHWCQNCRTLNNNDTAPRGPGQPSPGFAHWGVQCQSTQMWQNLTWPSPKLQ